MTDYPIAHTVAELIAELKKLPQDSVVMSHEPPFTGVSVIPQTDGGVFIASLPRPVATFGQFSVVN